MVLLMILSRMKSFLKSFLPNRSPKPGRRRFRDTPVRNAASSQKADVSPIRLVGYFVGGILLANLVLMASSAFRGHAAQAPAQFPAGISKRGPAAAAAATESALHIVIAADDDSTEPRTPAPSDGGAEHTPEPPKPLIAEICSDARERLVSGLSLYYLHRSRRPYASTEEVLASVEAIALLSGREDPAIASAGTSCAG